MLACCLPFHLNVMLNLSSFFFYLTSANRSCVFLLKVLIPQRGKEVEITSASQWELLNLDVDTILKMPFEVEAVTKLPHQEFMEIMESYLYESIGAQDFAQRHELKNTACVMVPSTWHISFAKAVTVLGLGRNSLIAVSVDKDARMDPKGQFIF